MNDRLDDFGVELVAAAARRRRRRSGRIAAGAATVAVTATAAAGAASNSLDPLSLFHSSPDGGTGSPFAPTTTSGRLSLASDTSGPDRWSATAYVSKQSGVCTAVATQVDQKPSVACRGGFPLADGFNRTSLPVSSTVVDLGADSNGTAMSLVYGVADASVSDLKLVTGKTTISAQRASSTITVQVPKDDPNLTSEGRKTAATLPDEVTVSLFAVPVPTASLSASPQISGGTAGKSSQAPVQIARP